MRQMQLKRQQNELNNLSNVNILLRLKEEVEAGAAKGASRLAQ